MDAFLYSLMPLPKRQKRFCFVSLLSEEVSEEQSEVLEEWAELSEDSSPVSSLPKGNMHVAVPHLNNDPNVPDVANLQLHTLTS